MGRRLVIISLVITSCIGAFTIAFYSKDTTEPIVNDWLGRILLVGVPNWDIQAYCKHQDSLLNSRQYGLHFAHENCLRSLQQSNHFTSSVAEMNCRSLTPDGQGFNNYGAMVEFGRPSIEECVANEISWKGTLMGYYFKTPAGKLYSCKKELNQLGAYISYEDLSWCVAPPFPSR